MQSKDGGAVREPVRHNNCSATIVDFNGRLFLDIKTDTHKGDKWVGLPHNFNKAVKAINKHLDNWPDLLLSQVKRNLTEMSQIRKVDLQFKKMNLTATVKKNMKKTTSNTISPTVAVLRKNTGFFALLEFFGDDYGDSEEHILC